MDTNKQTYEQEVLKKLPAIEPDELGFVQQAIVHCFDQKFTVAEAASYLRYLEHVDPDMDEDIALAGMRRIRAAVVQRLKTEGVAS
jgi:hypothetical protein